MGGLLVLYGHEEILPKSSLRPPKKKIGYGPLKNSGK